MVKGLGFGVSGLGFKGYGYGSRVYQKPHPEAPAITPLMLRILHDPCTLLQGEKDSVEPF